MSIVEKSITESIDTGYKDYAMYVLENRAIPSVVDGLKAVQRKLLYAMLNVHSGKKTKVSDLGGISALNYNHGETAAMAAAIGMAQEWNNNAPIFEQHGNFGSRLVQESAAPRYIYCSISQNYKKFFCDVEVAPKAFDPDNPEPAYYLPIVPWVLVNGIGGMAVGFKSEVLPRAIKDVLGATRAYIKNPKKFLEANAPIPPTFPHFKGNVIQHGVNQWKTQGVINFVGKLRYEITELPIGYDRESYVVLLNSLCDSDLIKDYDDNCSKAGFGFSIKVSAAQQAEIDKDPIKYFKLEKTHTEILTTMGVDGKLKIFQSVAELIGYFCDFRLKKFGDKIAYDIEQLTDEIFYLTHKKKFINAVIDGKISFKQTTKAELETYIFDNITPAVYGKSFARIPLYECTSDQVLKLDAEIIDKKSDRVVLQEQTTPEKVFSDKLASVKV